MVVEWSILGRRPAGNRAPIARSDLSEASMVDKTPTEIRAWVAAANITWFRKELDSETDYFRHNVLLALLENEFEKFAANGFKGHLLL
jgi:hypothetical protein